MKKFISAILTLTLVLSIFVMPMSVNAAGLPKSEVVDLDLSKVKMTEIEDLNGGGIVSVDCTDDMTVMVFTFGERDEDFNFIPDYRVVLTNDTENFETICLNDVTFENVSITGEDILYFEGLYYDGYAFSGHATCIIDGEYVGGNIYTEDFVSFYFFNNFESEYNEELGYYEVIKADEETGEKLISVNEKGVYLMTKDGEYSLVFPYADFGEIEVEFKDTNWEETSSQDDMDEYIISQQAKKGIVIYKNYMIPLDETVLLMVKHSLPDMFYTTDGENYSKIDTSSIKLNGDIESGKCVNFSTFTALDGTMILMVQEAEKVLTTEEVDDYTYTYYKFISGKNTIYALNEETLKFEKVDETSLLPDYDLYLSFASDKTSVMTGNDANGDMIGRIYENGVAYQYAIDMYASNWYYTTNDDGTVYNVTLNAGSEIYMTFDNFKTLGKISMDKAAIEVVGFTHNENRVLQVLDIETEETTYYILNTKSVEELMPKKEAVENPKGDVNGDNKLSVVDAKWILQNLAGNKNFDGSQNLSADLNGDGKVSVVDAKWVLQIVAGIRDAETLKLK